jgi:hypothetical protein
VKQRRVANNWCFGDEGDYIVSVSAIIDANDPGRIRRAGKRDRGEERQRYRDQEN